MNQKLKLSKEVLRALDVYVAAHVNAGAGPAATACPKTIETDSYFCNFTCGCATAQDGHPCRM